MFTIEFSEAVAEDLADLRAFDRKQILGQIDTQLIHQPTAETRNKKKLVGLDPPWEHAGPVWELRVGEFRVFYAVDEEEARVTVRAIRRKLPHKTTEGPYENGIHGRCHARSLRRRAQQEKVILTRNGHPIALIVSVDGMDEEQIRLSSDPEFWKLIEESRRQKNHQPRGARAEAGSSALMVGSLRGGGIKDDPRDSVRIELESGLHRNLTVIPILIDHARMPGEADLPPSLTRLAFPKLTTGRRLRRLCGLGSSKAAAHVVTSWPSPITFAGFDGERGHPCILCELDPGKFTLAPKKAHVAESSGR